MDLDLQTELRLSIKRRGIQAMVRLDDEGYSLSIEYRGVKTKIPLPDALGPSILRAIDDVSEVETLRKALPNGERTP